MSNTQIVIDWLSNQSYGRVFTSTEVRAETGIRYTTVLSRVMESLHKSGYLVKIGETRVKGKGYSYRVYQWMRARP